MLVNGDVWTDFPLERLALTEGDLASLVMVDTTDFHHRGDFHLDTDGRLHAEGEPRLIYAGLGVIRPQLVANLPIGTVAMGMALPGVISTLSPDTTVSPTLSR